MYLSRLTLDPRHPQVRRDLANPYEMHRTLARVHAPDAESPPRPFLWRLEAHPPTAGSAMLLAQSAVGANWQPLEAQSGYALEILTNKPVDLSVRVPTGGHRPDSAARRDPERHRARQGVGVGLALGGEIVVKVSEILERLKSDGWRLVATRGSHRQYKHDSKPGRVTVPGKPGDDLAPGTLSSIFKQAGWK